MHSKPKKTSFLILAVTAIVCSKVLFLLFNDPGGSNLVVVIGMALIVYFLSLAIYLFVLSGAGLKRLLLAILIQILITAGLFLFLK